MRKNYDLILNFESTDGEELSEYAIKDILEQSKVLAASIEKHNDVRVWKAIIALAIDVKRF